MWKVIHKLAVNLIIAVMLMIPAAMAIAKSVELEPLDSAGKRTWIIELADPSVVQFEGKKRAYSGGPQRSQLPLQKRPESVWTCSARRLWLTVNTWTSV